ncbi:hypothetical protein GCM10020219_067810 [Nonomuraea dietziae]
MHDLPSGHKVAWASGIHRDGRHTYVYGVEDLGGTQVHAPGQRCAAPACSGRWEYLKADGTWSADQADSARLMDGVANEYSVSRVKGGYVLITHDTTEILSSKIVAYTSCTPYGPFQQQDHGLHDPGDRREHLHLQRPRAPGDRRAGAGRLLQRQQLRQHRPLPRCDDLPATLPDLAFE